MFHIHFLIVLALADPPQFPSNFNHSENTPSSVRGPGDGEQDLSEAESGSISETLFENSALPMTEGGGLAQFRGLGRSPEDVSVEALGVPLNLPQGTGFDLSIFPKYLWSSYRFRTSEPEGAYDPRAISGTLTLTPRTVEALQHAERSESRLGFGELEDGVNEISAWGHARGDSAAVVGFDQGDRHGPSAGLSRRWKLGALAGSLHLLATDTDMASPGTRSFATPRARRFTTRAMPVLQTEYAPEESWSVRTSIFYDYTSIRYDDPDSAFRTRDQSHQAGIESAVALKDWRLHLSLHSVNFTGTGFSTPNESAVDLRAARTIPIARAFELEPELEGAGVSRYGMLPAGSLTLATAPANAPARAYLRARLSRRFPSLVDRYYSLPGVFNPNPTLRPESNWTTTLGGDGRLAGFEASSQAYAQIREDAASQIQTDRVYGMANAGRATVLAWMGKLSFHPFSWLELSHATTLSRSWVEATGLEFPYLPGFAQVISARVHSTMAGHDAAWEIAPDARVASATLADLNGNRVPSYVDLDLHGKLRLDPNRLYLIAKVENILDSPFELVRDYPLPGRTVAVLLSGEL